MKVEPYIISENTWWTVRLHPNQMPIGQLDFIVKRRPDGTGAKDMIELDAQERFIFSLISRSAQQAVEFLYQPKTVRWVCRQNKDGYCSYRLIPEFEVTPNHRLENAEIAEAIKEAIKHILSGRAN